MRQREKEERHSGENLHHVCEILCAEGIEMSKRPVQLEDLFAFKLAGDVQISPDGKRIAFTVKRADREKNKYYTRIWMADTHTREAQPFTGDGHSDGNPRWSPDGRRLAFISDRDKPGSQIYIIQADGGEAQKLTQLEEGSVQSLAWSPDGSRIAFLFRATPDVWREKAKKEREEKELSPPVRKHTKLFYRLDGEGYFDGSYAQIWVVTVATGEARRLTDLPHHLSAPSWSPDGNRLLFAANLHEDDDLEPLLDDLWIIPADGGEPVRLEAPAGPKWGPVFSPDGKWIAYGGHTDLEDTWGGRNDRVLVIPAEGGEARDLTGSSDLAVGYLTLADAHEVGAGVPIQWSPDSAFLYFPISAKGDTRLYRVPLATGELEPLTPAQHEMGGFSLSASGDRAGVLLGSAVDLYDAYLLNLAHPPELVKVSAVNQQLLSEVALQLPDEVWIPNGDGGTIQAWILRPPDFDPARKYPLVLYVHGGPALQYGGRAAPLHEHQWLAANGYVVLFSNPRGSKGYGEAYTMAIHGDWGHKDWEDIQSVADYGAALSYVDASRMAIMGGSYGGFMTAWAVGHTNRFRCAIADRLVGNLHSMSGTCDFPWIHGKEFKGNAWDDPSDLWRVSPLHYAGAIETPLLLIHSDGDLRCPIGQAEELFAALRHQRKIVEFVRYPANTSHGLSRNGPPDMRADRLQRNLAWLDRWLKEEVGS